MHTLPLLSLSLSLLYFISHSLMSCVLSFSFFSFLSFNLKMCWCLVYYWRSLRFCSFCKRHRKWLMMKKISRPNPTKPLHSNLEEIGFWPWPDQTKPKPLHLLFFFFKFNKYINHLSFLLLQVRFISKFSHRREGIIPPSTHFFLP